MNKYFLWRYRMLWRETHLKIKENLLLWIRIKNICERISYFLLWFNPIHNQSHRNCIEVMNFQFISLLSPGYSPMNSDEQHIFETYQKCWSKNSTFNFFTLSNNICWSITLILTKNGKLLVFHFYSYYFLEKAKMKSIDVFFSSLKAIFPMFRFHCLRLWRWLEKIP